MWLAQPVLWKSSEKGRGSSMTCSVPANRLHWYFNDECERSVMLAVLNPPEDVPAAFAVRRTFSNITESTPVPQAL